MINSVETVPDSGKAILLLPRKGEMYPVDLGGIEILSGTLSSWIESHLGALLLLENGRIAEFKSASVQETGLKSSLLSKVNFGTLHLKIEYAEPEIDFLAVKNLVVRAATDYHTNFYGDPDIDWKILRMPLDQLISNIETCESVDEVVTALGFPPIEQCLPTL